ncbi:ion channel [Plasmopara halstedii]|uniref:Ion channel n=1 Tax=Plasmopara halstedii TaxID=4781 RepID=A0A0P1A6V2_PLAHL|nr:ion channel [Plasmopara halstedii]CEG36037.1 ion channel [Plasmopara halstedii]|eukprot:XP_024572406.1 ion channel [Plasmopara halstedii]
MVAQVALTMDSITQNIDTKREGLRNALPEMGSTLNEARLAKRRSSKSRQTTRMDDCRSVSPQDAQQPYVWMTTMKESGKRAKQEAPKFLLLLYEILNVESSRVIRWSEDGLALQILDPVTVTEQVLPKYFNHTNFHSFQRQLNYFGFRKWTKSKTDICTFSHPFFRENQPELLQLIKRKKNPRRTPGNGASYSSFSAATAVGLTSRKVSPCAKRKFSSVEDESSDGFPAPATIQVNTLTVPVQHAINKIPLNPMTTPHGSSSNGALCFTHDSLARQHLPDLNNVISPVAATECKKKAKKLEKKDYESSATIHAPLTLLGDAPSSLVHTLSTGSLPSPSMSLDKSNPTVSDKDHAAVPPSTAIVSLPTLNIVRSRLIQRQNGGPEQQQQGFLQHQQYDLNVYPENTSPNEPQSVFIPSKERRPDLLTTSLGLTPVTQADMTAGQSTVFSSSFSDPVNILLRIKQSRTPTREGKDTVAHQEQGDYRNESLASLHNYLLGNSLYTNRLQAQLKYTADENESLKQLLNSKQREMNALQGECKALQRENSVLLEEKNKLFDINRDLLSKLFPL